jgi:hypothetical protein
MWRDDNISKLGMKSLPEFPDSDIYYYNIVYPDCILTYLVRLQQITFCLFMSE